MKDEKGSDGRRRKQTYTKPEVTKVCLKPNEAVLGGCKLVAVAGALNPQCTDTMCATIES